MRKDVDYNSQGLQNIESAVRGLQRKISLETESLVRRIEALECGKESHVSKDKCDIVQSKTQKGWCKDVIGRFEALEVKMKESQDCLHSSNSTMLSHVSSLAVAQELPPGDGGHAFRILDAPVAWSETHVKGLERLKEKLDEIQAATRSGDGAEPLAGTAGGDSTRVHACDGNTRKATGVGADGIKGIVNQDCSLSPSKVLMPCGLGNQEVVVLTSAEPVTPRSLLSRRFGHLVLPAKVGKDED